MDEKGGRPEGFIGPDSEFHKTIVRSVEPDVKALGNLIDARSAQSQADAPALPRAPAFVPSTRRFWMRPAPRSEGPRSVRWSFDRYAQQDALRRLDCRSAGPQKRGEAMSGNGKSFGRRGGLTAPAENASCIAAG